MKPALFFVAILCFALGGCISQITSTPEEHELIPIEISFGIAPHPHPKDLILSVDCFQDYAGSNGADRSKDRQLVRGRLNGEGVYWISLPKQPARYLRVHVSGGSSGDGSWRGLVDVDRSVDKIEKPIKTVVDWHSDVEGIELFQVPNHK